MCCWLQTTLRSFLSKLPLGALVDSAFTLQWGLHSHFDSMGVRCSRIGADLKIECVYLKGFKVQKFT